ncbi:pseudouridine kinase [Laceyella sediminis]|uniref:Pseudouridine kinase n=1 Tax=Laceyella sediminis TaxID=573074 RepID=A0ABX5EML7_9BACL|nr:carbohydrate kinase family protein [Laceyella sediminis]PRZ13556.1 pseudouridine kinase [Laceyella sediminis]
MNQKSVWSGLLCIGGAHLDRKAMSQTTVRLGSSNPAVTIETCGGVARNVAEAVARLGERVSLVSRVGRDRIGERVIMGTKRAGVDVQYVDISPTARTGTYTALIDANGELVVSFADTMIYEEMTVAWIEPRWPLIASAALVFLDTNLPEQTLQYVIGRCRREQIPVCVNLVSAVKAPKVKAHLEGLEMLFCNIEEAEALTGKPIGSPAEAETVANSLLEKGVKQVFLTLGGQGVICASATEWLRWPATAAAVVDATGAGDAFVAGVLVQWMRGTVGAEAVRFGLAMAQLTVQTVDNVACDLSFERIQQQLRGESA